MEIIAHRGAGSRFVQPDTPPENTVAAFEYAWRAGADAVELDLRITRDGELIVIHDATTRRTTGIRQSVRTHTLAELRRLDAGSWKSRRFAGLRLPTLEEAIETIPPGKRLVVEVKTGPEIVPRLCGLLARCRKPASQLAVIGFDWDTMRQIKERVPSHACYWLLDFRRRVPRRTKALIQRVRTANLDGLDISVRHPRSLPPRLRDEGLACIVWTVNRAATARRLLAAGVSGLTTDLPGQLREALAGDR